MLYFAYGSNLWLQQMSRRCPGSRFIGRAVLHDYQWQINERGFANVVRRTGCCVHGLVYSIDADDEARLDRSEGVDSGAYSKGYHDVILYPAASDLQKHPGRVLRSLDAYRDTAPPPEQRPLLQEGMLVYLSTDFVSPGQPREEYVHRINSGIRDAVALGVPPAFFQNAVRPLVPPEPGQSDRPNKSSQSYQLERPDLADRQTMLSKFASQFSYKRPPNLGLKRSLSQSAPAPLTRRPARLEGRPSSSRRTPSPPGRPTVDFASDCQSRPPRSPSAALAKGFRYSGRRLSRDGQMEPRVVDGDIRTVQPQKRGNYGSHI